MDNRKIIILSNEHYQTCKTQGYVKITKGGVEYTIYWKPDIYQYYTPAPNASSTESGLMTPAQVAKLEGMIEIPETTTAGQVLKSTGVSGTVEWGTASIVSGSYTGTSENYIKYLTIDGVEYKLSGDGGVGEITENTFIFKNDIVTMYTVGKYNGTIDNPVTIPVKNKSFKEAWNNIFVNTVNPTVTQPSWTDTYSESDVTGAIILSPTITLTFDRGTYQYGPTPTGVTVTSVTVNGVAKSLVDSKVTVNLNSITVPDTVTTLSVYSYSGAANPKNNIGEEVPSLKIADVTDQSASYVHTFASTGELGVLTPSGTITTNTVGSYEVGNIINPEYTLTFNNSTGYYPYGSDYELGSTSANLSTIYTRTIDSGTAETITAGTYNLPNITVNDSVQTKTIKLDATWSPLDNRIPFSPKVNKVPSKAITSGTSSTSKTISIPKGYRKIFYGYSTTDTLTSDNIRNILTGIKNQALTQVLLAEDKTKKCIIIAAPKDTRTLQSVTMPSSSYADVTSSFVKQTNSIQVEGANEYTAIDYDVWLYNPATMAGSYEITMK